MKLQSSYFVNFFAVLISIAFLTSTSGCGGGGGATATIELASNRTINVSVDRGGLMKRTTNSTATLNIMGKAVVVESEQVLIDKEKVCDLDGTEADINIKVSGGTITILAGGVEVYSGSI